MKFKSVFIIFVLILNIEAHGAHQFDLACHRLGPSETNGYATLGWQTVAYIPYFYGINDSGIFSPYKLERNQFTAEDPAVGRTEGLSNFFLLDAIKGYRLPARKGLLSFEVRNLLDESFYFRNSQFFVSQPIAPRYTPDRTFFVRLTLNF